MDGDDHRTLAAIVLDDAGRARCRGLVAHVFELFAAWVAELHTYAVDELEMRPRLNVSARAWLARRATASPFSVIAATAPMTITAGASIAVSASSSSRQRATTWSSVVAERTAATGVSAGPARRPSARRRSSPVGRRPSARRPCRRPGQRAPVDVGLAGAAVTGDDRERGGDATVRDRDAGRGRARRPPT